jgi:tetratricopeptide (TPR) repeat protein
MMVSPAPVIGASGSIAAVTGAFLAIAPRSRIIVLFLLGGAVMAVPSLWFIGLYFAIDLLNQFVNVLGHDGGNVAYMAHIVGYLYGFGTAFVLLAIGYIPRRDCDVLYLFTQARRRAALRAANRSTPAGAWESAAADTGRRLQHNAQTTAPPTETQLRVAAVRSDINRAAAAHDLAAAAAVYRKLLDEAPDSAFNEQRQLELANQLYVEHDHAHAATAYELLLDRYPAHAGAAEVRLILGVMYARHLKQPGRAREVIDAAKPSLRDPTQSALADALLAELHG